MKSRGEDTAVVTPAAVATAVDPVADPRSAVTADDGVPASSDCGSAMLLLCAGCDGPILDRFLLNVLDRVWHAKCVRCCECGCPLTDKCFARDGRLFCRHDFFRYARDRLSISCQLRASRQLQTGPMCLGALDGRCMLHEAETLTTVNGPFTTSESTRSV